MKTLIAVLALCTTASLAQTLPSAQSVLQKLEDIQKFTTDVHTHVKLTQQKTNQGTKITEMEYFRRDKDEAFMIQMLAPESDRGNGYLRVSDNMWMYRRNTRTFQHINSDESIAGSDAKADDFKTRNVTETWAIEKTKDGKEKLSEQMLGKVPVYKLEVAAKVNDVDYPKKIWWVRRDNNLLLKEEGYSQSGTLMETAYFLKYTMVNNRYVPVNQLFIDEFEKGNRTVVDLSNIKTDKLEDGIFTKAYLESQSK